MANDRRETLTAMKPRVLTSELMDDPTLDERTHLHALHGLSRLNFLSRAHAPLISGIRNVCREAGRLDSKITLLDVACGGGDVLKRLLGERNETPGVITEVIASDISPVALSQAAKVLAEHNNVVYYRADILDNHPLPHADIVLCSLFMHHLTAQQAVLAITAMARAARVGVIISDLRRCAFGTLLTRFVPRMITTSHIVHADAVKSANAAWTLPELRALAESAGLHGAKLTNAFPARMLLTWNVPTTREESVSRCNK